MKMFNLSTSAKLAVVCSGLLLAACTTKPAVTEDTSGGGSGTTTIVQGSAEDFRVNVGDTVNFDFDRYDLDSSDRATLDRQAAWLAQYPSVVLTIEGHCDERGTREYNLALGARRANSVREYLVSRGVSASRLETISYGKERPICLESNEACWAQNRRGVSVVSGGAAGM